MNISIRHIQHFIAVAQELHFRRAAQLANVAQPALSRSVQTLENELGVQLLARNNRNVKLTAAGKEFLAGSTQIIDAIDLAIAKSIRAGQTEIGGLNVGYTYIAMCGNLAATIGAFESQNPGSTIDPINESSAVQIEKLHHDELDCCFVTGPVNAPEIETAVVQTDAFIVIVHNLHPLATKGSISVEELAMENLLLASEANASTFNQHVHQFFAKAQLQPSIEYVQQNHVGILGKVALGRGVCIATEGYGCVYAKELRTLRLTGTDAQLPTLMAWRKDLHNEATIRFRDYVLSNETMSTEAAKPDQPNAPIDLAEAEHHRSVALNEGD